MTASLLSNDRVVPDFGANGGEPGACGRNLVMRADERTEELGFVASIAMRPGNVFIIGTPGGAGDSKAN